MNRVHTKCEQSFSVVFGEDEKEEEEKDEKRRKEGKSSDEVSHSSRVPFAKWLMQMPLMLPLTKNKKGWDGIKATHPPYCVADNALGRTKKYIEVSGRPGPAAFLSPAYSNYLDRYNLTYTIESIPPLDEIKLLYRKLMSGDCSDSNTGFQTVGFRNSNYEVM
uniref:Uncharacterized protein n=1 Tax=Anopheles culicifacies TaxID=139723 RepID=A0A182LZT1_9DIPT